MPSSKSFLLPWSQAVLRVVGVFAKVSPSNYSLRSSPYQYQSRGPLLYLSVEWLALLLSSRFALRQFPSPQAPSFSSQKCSSPWPYVFSFQGVVWIPVRPTRVYTIPPNPLPAELIAVLLARSSIQSSATCARWRAPSYITRLRHCIQGLVPSWPFAEWGTDSGLSTPFKPPEGTSSFWQRPTTSQSQWFFHPEPEYFHS